MKALHESAQHYVPGYDPIPFVWNGEMEGP